MTIDKMKIDKTTIDKMSRRNDYRQNDYRQNDNRLNDYRRNDVLPPKWMNSNLSKINKTTFLGGDSLLMDFDQFGQLDTIPRHCLSLVETVKWLS